MKVGIMGGTFDPIHFGHLEMAESAREIFSLDKVIFIPSARPPHKVNNHITPDVHRLQMTYLATQSNKNFQVSAMEFTRAGLSYTLDTIEELYKEFGADTELFFIIGSDSMADLPKWHKARELVQKVHFIAAARPGVEVNFDELKKFFGEESMQHIHQIESPKLEISSTDLRDRIFNGRSIKYLVPEVVEKYIYQENLYSAPTAETQENSQALSVDKMRETLQRRLKKERFAHSIGVANTAVKLAKKFGVDENKAYIAGLLHDCARQFENNELPAEAEKRGIEIGEVEKSMPLLLHSYIGAKLIEEIYGVHDKEISQAIYRHTVGARDMTPLDKIIYFADMIEPNRNYPGVEKLRALAEESDNLDEIILTALNESIIFVIQKNSLVHPDTIDARNFLLLQKEKLK